MEQADNKKSILIITSEFPPLPGGIGNHAYHLARMMALSHIQTTVLTNFRQEDTKEEIEFDRKLGFKIHRVKRYRISFFSYLERCWEVVRLIYGKPPLQIIASGKFSLWLAGATSLFFSRHKYMAVIHGTELQAGGCASKNLTRWSLSRFATLIAVSRFTGELLRSVCPGLAVNVINNGFSPAGIEKPATICRLDGKPALITVGNVTWRKGQQNVIRALPAVKKLFPEVVYHMVGIPTEQTEFLQLAKTLGVEADVRFHGAVSQEALAGLLAGADIFLMLSERLPNGDVEGFGIAILEANHLGIPAIGANDSGPADAIKHGFSGMLVPSKQPEAVAAAVQAIWANYESFSLNANQWCQQFTWEKVIESYFSLLK